MEKIAIIEIDSRQLRLTLANIIKNGHYSVFDQVEDSVKLGEDLEKDNFFKANRVAESINILKGYKKLCDANQILKIDCVITNDCKLAKNLKSFIDEVSTNIGVKVRVLESEEELKAVYIGVVNTLEIPKGIICKIGFESTSIISYIRRTILSHTIIPIGVCTLAEKFKDNKNLIELSKQYFANEIKNIEGFNSEEAEFQLVGVGTIFSSISKISRMATKYSYDKSHNYNMQEKDVNAVYEFFKTLDVNSKQKIRGISSDRADFVAVGVAIAKAVFDRAKCENLFIGEFDLADGLIINYTEPQTLDKPITDILGHSLETQRLTFEESMSNSENVYTLSMLLYKQLRVLHKLPRTYVKVLRIASYFYNSGVKINFYNNEKNSYSAVLNANVYGVGHKEQILAAFVCASQNNVDFNLAEFTKYRDILTSEDLDAVKKLAVIVKMAKGLDKCGSGAIKDITCDILGDSVILKAISEDKVDFEIKEAMRVQEDFKKAYKKNLEIL